MKTKSFIQANMVVALLASSATMLWLLWKFPVWTAIATVGVVAFLLVSAQLAATASDSDAGELDPQEHGVGLQ